LFSHFVAGRYNDSLHTDARRLLLSSFTMGLCAGEFKAVSWLRLRVVAVA
jgi:hypothetical protein